MVVSCFSLVKFYEGFLRRAFGSAGLSPRSLEIDQETTLHFWGPTPSKQEEPSSKSIKKNKPALILIHGFGPLAVWQWRSQVQSLSPFFNLYVPDLVFFGGSTTSCLERSEVFQAESVGRLMEKLGVESYSVMGTSYGGFVSYHMARIWPERVEKVVIASSGVNITAKDTEELMRRANVEKVEDLMLPHTPSQLRTLMRLAIFKPAPRLPDFLLHHFLRNLYTENREEKIELLKGVTLGQDEAANISPLPQEVLLVWGEHDQIFPLKLATELRELLGENAKLEVIKNTSHVPQVEYPQAFNNVVKEFLE